MTEQHETFPSALEAIFLVLALFFVEQIIVAVLHDFKLYAGDCICDLSGPVALMANGVVFSGLMYYKRLRYSALFHSGQASALAVMSRLSVPLLLIVPGLTFAVITLTTLWEGVWPSSAAQRALIDLATQNPFIFGVSVCVLAPVLEEMFFRGVILRSFLQQYSRRAAIIGSALLFGAAHLNGPQFVAGAVLGCVLGWVYERTRSLWPCIFLHAVYNVLVSVILFQSSPSSNADWLPSGSLMAVALGLALMGIFFLNLFLSPRQGKA
ncbi:CPBP family intramembrane glutamic endopeptidase [Uliginosibacterium gangwonense]|uniref:CPBP family intramembrane glutamic endopeptidase n=1 Tax=Uliginosibacterium gangwonense TaxID=392736 RepID=UPI000374D5AD|nr:type II CAAX endopeptidase family protein [Uliginosibacterium gangwonense]